MTKNSRWPPSSMGTGSRFSTARFTLMMAVNSASDARPSLACRPASVAIWIGPPMLDESIWRDDELPEALDRQHRHVPRLDGAVADGRRAGCRARSGPPWWRCRPGSGRPRRSSPVGALLLHRRRRHASASSGLPSRSTVIGEGLARPRCGSPATSSSGVKTGWPATAITTSPGLSPARSAGEPGLDRADLRRRAAGPAPMSQISRGSWKIGSRDRASPRRDRHGRARRRRARTVSSSGRPSDAAIARSRSSQYAIGRPLTATTCRRCAGRRRRPGCPRRPGRRPRGHTGRPSVPSTTAKITAASTKFIPGPAKTIRKRAHSGLRANALLES